MGSINLTVLIFWEGGGGGRRQWKMHTIAAYFHENITNILTNEMFH